MADFMHEILNNFQSLHLDKFGIVRRRRVLIVENNRIERTSLNRGDENKSAKGDTLTLFE